MEVEERPGTPDSQVEDLDGETGFPGLSPESGRKGVGSIRTEALDEGVSDEGDADRPGFALDLPCVVPKAVEVQSVDELVIVGVG